MCKTCFSDFGLPNFDICKEKLRQLEFPPLELPNHFEPRLYKAFNVYLRRLKSKTSDNSFDLAQVIRAETHLRKNPDNSFERQKLVQYYRERKEFDEHARNSFHKHALFLVAYAPESPFLPSIDFDKESDRAAYEKAEKLWLDHIARNPDNAEILENAYIYYMTKDLGVTGIIAKRLKELEPKNLRRVLELVRYYRYMMLHTKPAASKLFALNTYLELKDAFENFSGNEKLLFLKELPEAAYDAGLKDKAIEYAKKMILYLEAQAFDISSIDNGAAFHRSHLWIARIAFEEGDEFTAKKHFLEAARYQSDIKQSLVGPDLYLADKFLQAKEYRIVFKYFKICSVSWKHGIILDWLEEMQDGRMPDLQAYML